MNKQEYILFEILRDLDARGVATANEVAFRCNATVREVFYVVRKYGLRVEYNSSAVMKTSTIYRE